MKGTGVCGRMDEERPWLWLGHVMEMLYTLRVIGLQLFLNFCLYVTLWLAKPKKKKGIVSLQIELDDRWQHVSQQRGYQDLREATKSAVFESQHPGGIGGPT